MWWWSMWWWRRLRFTWGCWSWKSFKCRHFHKKDHFCLDDECAPVLPGDKVHFCNRCSRTWHTENPRVFLRRDIEENYREDKPDNFRSDGTYIEEDEDGTIVTKSQPFDRRKKNA